MKTIDALERAIKRKVGDRQGCVNIYQALVELTIGNLSIDRCYQKILEVVDVDILKIQ